ncbi:hypothetical protein AOL_s00169g154 [Orbilia oligospora ATCC 24927]|uniref:Uncharacterized protein n=1 Tax=Arthrobotrys oligospora (strain ATCC 24927 / CBS 115.81 / DSM 1491) TaxID=756982 RepID=G1XMV1_ARTOA|nr:hypothetical protein AOL_s00169g154 [Orbilia oligospora ATCC 24927]EGX45548.1 hypothetical protein AOL_s00169g154 [Orbilia oligospora ATCC 24927]
MSFLCSDCALMTGGVPCPRCFSIHTPFHVQGEQNVPGQNVTDSRQGQPLETPYKSFVPEDIGGFYNGQFSKNSVTNPAKGMMAPSLLENNQNQGPNRELAVQSLSKVPIDAEHKTSRKPYNYTSTTKGFMKRAPVISPVKYTHYERYCRPIMPKVKRLTVGLFTASCNFPNCSAKFSSPREPLATSALRKHQRQQHHTWAKEVTRRDAVTLAWKETTNSGKFLSGKEPVEPKEVSETSK